jgi:KH/beta-lactamase-domain protein
VFNNSNIKLTFLGGFKEVGRSCIYAQTDESNVLLDCGLNVGNPNDLFPFLDIKDFCLEDLDAVIITHAHLDHSGLVPFLYKYEYNGPTYCTLPTKHLMTMLQLDYVNLTEKDGRVPPYSRRDVKNTVLHTYPISYGKVIDIAPDIKLTLHNSGHIIGSAMAHLHFGSGEHNLVYTGDYKFQKSRLLDVANAKFPRLETLITESTYGGSQDNIPSRIESEKRFISVINKTIDKGGKLLVPVLAVGRAQEIIVQLEDFISREMIKRVPVYIDGLIAEATAIHTTHPDFLNSDLRELIFHQQKNPFMSEIFTTVGSSDAREEIINGGPCIILATSGMLQGGPSLGYLKGLAEDENSTLLFVGYQVEGTLGKRIQKGYREFVVKLANGKGLPIKINMNVQTISGFSGHSSRSQIISFIRKVNPKPDRIIVNHGEASKCVSLAALIHKRLKIETKAPLNKETIIL